VRWLPLDALRDDDPPLYPDGMFELAETLDSASDR
jgi:hypothetical protein